MHDGVSETARLRGDAYRFLATLFVAPPDAGGLACLAVGRGTGGGGGEPTFAHRLCDALPGTDPAKLVERLAVEHARLFRGISETYGPPPPYESLWREGRLMGEATEAVLRTYLDAGFIPDPRFAPGDHIVDELNFLAALCHAEADAPGTDEALRYQALQVAFLGDHLEAWVPGYCERLIPEAREPFYVALAEVTVEVVRSDQNYLRSVS